jgi:hypothetical protein
VDKDQSFDITTDERSLSKARTFVYDLGLDKCSLYNLNHLVYDLTPMPKVWDVPSNSQYNTSSNILNGNFERSQ